MGGRGRLVLGVLLAVAIALLVGQTLRAAVDPGVTLDGTLSGGGSVRITLTADRSAVMRAELTDATFQYYTPSGVQTTTVSRTLYYHPPFAVADGHLQLGLPIHLFGMARSSVLLEGDLTDADHLAGTATLVACIFAAGCSDLATVTWSAAGPVGTPPAPGDQRFKGELAPGGAIALTLDGLGGVTSLDLDGVPVDPCMASLDPLSLHLFFDPPADGASLSVLVQTPKGLHSLVLQVESPVGQTMSGTVLFASFYGGDCITEAGWAARINQPPSVGGVGMYPTSLPSGGRGVSWSLWLPTAAALLAVAALAFARGRARR